MSQMRKHKTYPIASLRELYRYDPATGSLHLRKSSGGRVAGSKAGSVRPDGYSQISIRKNLFLAHRVAWALHYGAWPSREVDHRNLDRTDNRISNLRLASSSQNKSNATKRARNKSGIKGVCWHRQRGKWHAQIQKNYKHRSLGLFDCKHEAGRAYAAASSALHQEFGRTG